MSRTSRLERTTATRRLVLMLIAGVVVAVVAGLLTSWWYAPLAGWCAAAFSFVLVVWWRVGRLGAEHTRVHATREDPGIVASDGLILGASLASLIGVGVLLFVHSATDVSRAGEAALALASVALSWTLIHTLYTLRYAREYYTDPVGGIDFNSDEAPRYTDFAYVAFDLGMTYQISDTTLRTSRLRAIVLRHTLLSYVFGAVVLATTINLVVGLAQ